MTNDTLTLFGTVLETKNSMTAKRLLRLKKIIKQIHHSKSPQNPNGESRMTDITTENRTTKRISRDITKRKRSNLVYAIYAVLT